MRFSLISDLVKNDKSVKLLCWGKLLKKNIYKKKLKYNKKKNICVWLGYHIIVFRKSLRLRTNCLSDILTVCGVSMNDNYYGSSDYGATAE